MSEPLDPALPPADPTAHAAPPMYAAPPAYNVNTPPPDAYDAQPPLSQVERVVDTFVAPSKTFADIRRNRSWWLPLLLLAAFGYAFSFVAIQKVGLHALAVNSLNANPKAAEKMNDAPPEQRAKILQYQQVGMSVGLFAGPVFTLVFTAIIALLLWGGFNFLLGGRSTYSGMFAVSLFSYLPSLVQVVLWIVMILVGDAETFNIANAAGTNPGFYLGPAAPAALRSFLTSIDLFTIWELFLMGLGGAIVARVKPARGLLLVFGFWIIIVLIKTGFAAATS